MMRTLTAAAWAMAATATVLSQNALACFSVQCNTPFDPHTWGPGVQPVTDPISDLGNGIVHFGGELINVPESFGKDLQDLASKNNLRFDGHTFNNLAENAAAGLLVGEIALDGYACIQSGGTLVPACGRAFVATAVLAESAAPNTSRYSNSATSAIIQNPVFQQAAHDPRVKQFAASLTNADFAGTRFALKASNNLKLSAMGGGNSQVLVHGASIQDWEEFATLESGALRDGAVVHILSTDGYFLSPDPAANQLIAQEELPRTDNYDTFKIVKSTAAGSGASISSGDTVWIMSLGVDRWLTGIPSQDGQVNVNRTVPSTWETFEIIFL